MGARSQIRATTVWTVALNLLALTFALFVLWKARVVVAWIAVALFLALALDPAVAFLQGKGLRRRGLAVLVVGVFCLGIVAGLVVTFVPMLVEQGRALISQAPEMLEKVRDHRFFQWADQRFDVVDRMQSQMRARGGGEAAGSVLGVVGSIFEGLLGVLTVTSLTLFMLLFGGPVVRGALEWVHPSKRAHYAELTRKAHKSVGGYVAGTFLIAAIGGVVTAIATLALGVPYFLPLGLAMMLLGVVPFIGSALGALLVVGTTFASAGTKAGLIALGIFLVYQQVENELLQPLIQRKTIQMNALIIAVVMLIGTSLLGVLGALLSLPIAGAVQVVLQDVLERRKQRWREGARDDSAERQPQLNLEALWRRQSERPSDSH